MRLSSLRAAWTRLHETFRRPMIAAEQDEEFRFHVDMETAENIRRGMTGPDARRAALLRFGGTQRFREETRDTRGLIALDNIARDARLALRRVRRAPGFATGVIATLGIGIGVAIGIGAIVWGVLLRDLPYDESDRLVSIGFHTDGIPTTGDLQSSATYFHFAKSARSFSAIGTYWTSEDVNLTDKDVAESVIAASVTPSVLTALRIRPLMGTLFEPGDTSWYRGRNPILISEALWRGRYGSDPAIIGRSIDINRGERTVLGVMPRSFAFPSPDIAIWYPAATSIRKPELDNRVLHVIGRLRDGVTLEGAAAELNALVPALSARFPTITSEMLRRSGARATVTTLKAATVAPIRPQLLLLGGLVAVVLLIATTNVVNLFLLRTERASQEIAIALSLGASRVALAQRFMIEGIVLGVVSTLIALPAAALAVSTKFGFTEREIPRLHEVSFTTQTVSLVLFCAVAIGTLVGLTALTRTGIVGLSDRLRATRSTSSRTWRRTQNGLVAFQVAIALSLLVAAGLLGRSFWNLRTANIGFQPANAITAQGSLPYGPTGYTTYAEHVGFHARIMDRLAALPGVTSVGATLYLPLTRPGLDYYEMTLQAGDGQNRPAVTASGNMASADYFVAIGIPLNAGRTFRAGDLRGTTAVVVSQRLANNLFGTSNVVGRRINSLRANVPPTPFTIVGVVGDVHGERIEDGYLPMAYFPILRDGDGLPADSRPTPFSARNVRFAVRAALLPTPTAIQGIVKDLDRRVPVNGVRTLGSFVDEATARVRLTMLLIAVAGGAALALGVIGVYSVISYSATERVREFGIRIAVGASPARVGSIVLRSGARLVAVGAVVGLVASVASTRFLRSLLYEVQPTSVTEFALATTVLLAVSAVAIVVPARRAARTDPALVLRGD